MTPRRLDADAVVGKLRAMRRLLDTLHSLGPVDRDRLDREFSTQLIVERIVSHLVDLAAGINAHVAAVEHGEAPRDLRRSFVAASATGMIEAELAERLAPSAGLRNVLVHAYLDLDVSQLVAAVPLATELYGEYVRQTARWLAGRGAGGAGGTDRTG